MDKLKKDIKNKDINDKKLKVKKIDLKKNDVNNLSLNIKKLSYIMNLVNYSINTKFLNKKNFINILKDDIYKSTEINLNKKDIFNLLKCSIENKDSFNKINKFNNNQIDMKGGSMNEIFDWNKNTNSSTKILDVTSLFLDIMGLIPIYGIVFDGSNVILNLIRGDILNAAFSLIALVPVIGVIGPSLKLGYKLTKKRKQQIEKIDKSEDSEDSDDSEESEDSEESDDSDDSDYTK